MVCFGSKNMIELFGCLKVNETKTEMCLFHRNDKRLITLNLNNIVIKSTPQIKVLGIIFDSKLQWTEQVANCIKKSTRNLHAIKIISKYFNNEELKTLITSNFYTVLYYNSEIWHLPSLNPYLKGLLLSASSKALKICTPSYNLSMSYNDLHVINNRATYYTHYSTSNNHQLTGSKSISTKI